MWQGDFILPDDERILRRLGYDVKVIGLLNHDMSTLKQQSPVKLELACSAFFR